MRRVAGPSRRAGSGHARLCTRTGRRASAERRDRRAVAGT
ncbi:hypothetical protein PA598K_07293, partial [Paenibacillus sp. 598K]